MDITFIVAIFTIALICIKIGYNTGKAQEQKNIIYDLPAKCWIMHENGHCVGKVVKKMNNRKIFAICCSHFGPQNICWLTNKTCIFLKRYKTIPNKKNLKELKKRF